MKIWNYCFIMIGVVLILQFSGFNTSMDFLFDIIGINFGANNTIENISMSNSEMKNLLFQSNESDSSIPNGLLAALLGSTAITIGIYLATKDTNILLLPFITSVVYLFGSTMWNLLSYYKSIDSPQWLIGIMALILIPFSVGFIVAIWEFVRGTD